MRALLAIVSAVLVLTALLVVPGSAIAADDVPIETCPEVEEADAEIDEETRTASLLEDDVTHAPPAVWPGRWALIAIAIARGELVPDEHAPHRSPRPPRAS